MKRFLAMVLVLIMMMSLAACSGVGNNQPQADSNSPSNRQENTPDETAPEENGRKKATEFTFELAAEEERIVENLIFDEDVTVSGDFGIIVFENCEFNGDIINTAELFTRVCFGGETTVNGNCVFKNTTKEATMDTPLPKFIVSQAVNIVCEDCIGACVQNNPEESIIFNGKTYTLADAEYFWDPETNGVVPYEGQETTVLVVGQWWENGEKIMFIEGE